MRCKAEVVQLLHRHLKGQGRSTTPWQHCIRPTRWRTVVSPNAMRQVDKQLRRSDQAADANTHTSRGLGRAQPLGQCRGVIAARWCDIPGAAQIMREAGHGWMTSASIFERRGDGAVIQKPIQSSRTDTWRRICRGASQWLCPDEFIGQRSTANVTSASREVPSSRLDVTCDIEPFFVPRFNGPRHKHGLVAETV